MFLSHFDMTTWLAVARNQQGLWLSHHLCSNRSKLVSQCSSNSHSSSCKCIWASFHVSGPFGILPVIGIYLFSWSVFYWTSLGFCFGEPCFIHSVPIITLRSGHWNIHFSVRKGKLPELRQVVWDHTAPWDSGMAPEFSLLTMSPWLSNGQTPSDVWVPL